MFISSDLKDLPRPNFGNSFPVYTKMDDDF